MLSGSKTMLLGMFLLRFSNFFIDLKADSTLAFISSIYDLWLVRLVTSRYGMGRDRIFMEKHPLFAIFSRVLNLCGLSALLLTYIVFYFNVTSILYSKQLFYYNCSISTLFSRSLEFSLLFDDFSWVLFLNCFRALMLLLFLARS